jgi:hypothetical protein
MTSGKKLTLAQIKKHRANRNAFSQRLTIEDITDFDGRLVAVK